MTHKEILTAFRNGNTEVTLTCQRTGEELVCTILRAGAKKIHIALSPNYVQQYENRGDINYDYQMLKVINTGA